MLITESRFDKQLKRIGLIKENKKGILSIKITDPGGNMIEGYKPKLTISKRPLTFMAKEATMKKSGSNVEGYRDYRGIKVSGAWLWDDLLGLGLTTEIDTKEAMKPYHKTKFIILMVLSFTVILTIILFTFLLSIEKKSREKLKKAYHHLEEKVEERTIELALLNKKLQKLSYIDGLTSIANRRKFNDILELEWNHAQRSCQNLSMVLMDIDFFKQYNDFYGHIEGDNCLKTVAKTLNSLFKRKIDLFARYGGEEFVLLLPNTSLQDATVLAEKCKRAVLQLKIAHKSSNVHSIVTISLGVASMIPKEEKNPSSLIEKADKLLYKAKNSGRNTVQS